MSLKKRYSRWFDRRWYLFNEPDLLEEPEALFVYGTLRTADPRNYAEIHGELYDVGVAVALHVGNPGSGIIQGELLYCERDYLLTTLDRYEGYPTFYGRERVTTVCPEEVECWVYVAGPNRESRLNEQTRLPSPACWHRTSYEAEVEWRQDMLDRGEDDYEIS